MKLNRSALGTRVPAVALAILGLSAEPATLPHPNGTIELAYGSHPLQKLDLWRPDGPGPFPILVDFHGGGFCGGDKRDIQPELVAEAHRHGIAVASANYRLTPDVAFPAPMLDGARAVQFLRANALRWKLDGARIALAGNSAGGGIALWLALHDDLVRPDSADPIDLASTRVACAAVVGAQTSYDPAEIQEWIGGRAHEHPALSAFLGGLGRGDRATWREASPIEHAGSGDPPIWMSYSESTESVSPRARPGQGIHHPNFGFRLRDRLVPLGIACKVRLEANRENENDEMTRDLIAFVCDRFDSMSSSEEEP